MVTSIHYNRISVSSVSGCRSDLLVWTISRTRSGTKITSGSGSVSGLKRSGSHSKRRSARIMSMSGSEQQPKSLIKPDHLPKIY
jgi:hypothetical protein